MKITVLAARGRSTAILLNWLPKQGYHDLDVILERPVSQREAVLRRSRRLGWPTALGQVLFRATIVPVLSYVAKRRVREILAESDLDSCFPEIESITTVDSINDPDVIQRLQRRNPDIVLVNGTGIISETVLAASSVPFVNTHVGITPQYRGVHGGYWALWNRDPESFGVTLHLVDKGVDTGQVLFQVKVRPHTHDSFATYPLVQQAAALPSLKIVLDKVAEETPLPLITVSTEASRQWYHPTILQYLRARLRGVR